MKLQFFVTAIVLLVALLFTLFGFFIPQPCDLDAVYLWCRLHPFTTADFLGVSLFYAGCGFLAGLPIFKNLELFNDENSNKWGLLFFAAMVLGVVLIWNL